LSSGHSIIALFYVLQQILFLSVYSDRAVLSGEFYRDYRSLCFLHCSASLASLTREVGPQVVKGDPAGKGTPSKSVIAPRLDMSDSALKFTHVLYNLSPAELYEQAIKSEKGSYITSTGALATLSGAKTGRSPKDKRVVKEETSKDDLWWGKYVLLNLPMGYIRISGVGIELKISYLSFSSEPSISPSTSAEALQTLKWMRRRSW
jgi:hypothetical protein